MATVEDVLIRFMAVDMFSNMVQGMSGKLTNFQKDLSKTGEVGQKTMGALKFAAGAAMAGIGAGIGIFLVGALQKAMNASKEWATIFGTMHLPVDQWNTAGKEIKEYAYTFSESMGMNVADTREAIKNAANYGLTWEETKPMLETSASVAAASGKTISESQLMIQQALSGRGMALKRLTGLDLDQFKNEEGHIDRLKLMDALNKKYSGSLEAYKNTEVAAVERANAAWEHMRVSIGSALIPAIKPLIDVIIWVIDLFNNLPAPIRESIAVGLALSSVLLMIGGAFLMIAPGIHVVMGLVGSLGGLSGILTLLGVEVPVTSAALTGMGLTAQGTTVKAVGLSGALRAVGASALAAAWPILIIVGAVAAAAAAVWVLEDRFHVLGGSTYQANKEMDRLNKNAVATKNNQEKAAKAVDSARAALDREKEGTPEWVKAKENLTNAETAYGQAVNDANTAETNKTQYQKDLAEANQKSADSYTHLARALLGYEIAMGTVKGAEAEQRQKEIEGALTGDYSYITQKNKETADREAEAQRIEDDAKSKRERETRGIKEELAFGAGAPKELVPGDVLGNLKKIFSLDGSQLTKQFWDLRYGIRAFKDELAKNPNLGFFGSLLQPALSLLCAILGCSPGLLPAFQLLSTFVGATVKPVMDGLGITFKTIADAVSWLVTKVGELLNLLPNLNQYQWFLGNSGVGGAAQTTTNWVNKAMDCIKNPASCGFGGDTLGLAEIRARTPKQTIHIHNETLKVDASRLTADEAMRVLTQIYEGNAKRTIY